MSNGPPSASLLARLSRLDAALSERIALRPGPWRTLALVAAHSGDSPLWLAAAAAVLLWAPPAWHPFGLRTLTAHLLGGLTAGLLKWVFRRKRPGGPDAFLYTRLDHLAFPSGHATRTACMTVLLAPVVPAWATALMTLWAIGVALARVALKVHYLSDVLAGLALGCCTGVCLLGLL